MSQIYRTKEGDTLDFIVWKQYGQTSGVVEQVLLENQNLANYGEVLPAGILITLPDISTTVVDNGINLWD